MVEFEILEDPKNPFEGFPTIVYQYRDDSGQMISIGAVSVKNDDALAIAFALDPKMHKKGIGKAAFVKRYHKYAAIYNIKYIIGTWKRDIEYSEFEDCASTNLTVFNNLISQGINIKDAALSTPTGKWTKAIGYDKVKIIRVEEDWVEMHFYRELPELLKDDDVKDLDLLELGLKRIKVALSFACNPQKRHTKFQTHELNNQILPLSTSRLKY